MLQSAAPKPTEPGLGDLVEDALHQAKTLVQAELSLARGELKDELKQALGSVVMLAAGAMCLQSALLTLGVLLVLALGAGAGSALVVLGFLAFAALFGLLGLHSLRRSKLPRTKARLSSDAKQVLETTVK